MNRVRKFGDLWQVLLTPTRPFDAGYELLRGTWYAFDDNNIRNYRVINFNTLQDAQNEAFNYPDIEWDKLVLMHQNAFLDIGKMIKGSLHEWGFIVEYDPRITDALTYKNTIFDRVMIYGSRFNISYQMNDVISFNIVNPWKKNLEELAQKLELVDGLHLKKKITVHGVIHLIGLTDLGTTYEICLWPTLISQWAKWIRVHNPDQQLKDQTLKDILKTQSTVDNGIVLR